MNGLFVQLIFKLGYATLALSLAAWTVSLLFRAARVRSPAVHRWAWCLVLLQGIVFWRVTVELPWPQADSLAESLPSSGWQAAPAAAGIDVNPPPIAPLTTLARPARPANMRQTMPPAASGLLLAIWLGGMLVVLGRSCLGYVSFWRSLPVSHPLAAEWCKELADLCRELGISQPISLHGAGRLGPALCWLPGGCRLLVPIASWRELTATQRQAVLRHELAHYRRGDLWKSLAMRLIAVPQWFNPLAWMALRRFDEAAEWACDDAVQEGAPDATFDYLRALIQLSGPAHSRPSLQAAIGGGSVPYRIRRLLSSEQKDSTVRILTIFTLTLAVAAAGLAQLRFAAAQTPALKGTTEASTADPPGESKEAEDPAIAAATERTAPELAEREAMIDMARVFKADRSFLARQQVLRDKQGRLASEIKRDEAKLNALAEKQRTTSDQELAKLLQIELQADNLALQKRIGTQRKELLDEEAAAYHEAFERIRAEVARYAHEHGIRQVRRAQSVVLDNEPVDLKDRHAVLARLNRDIIYSAPQQVDITEAIIQRLNRGESDSSPDASGKKF